MQKRAVEALVSIGGHAVEPLMNMLADADSTAATILGEIGEPAVTSLVNALGADDSWVRCGALGENSSQYHEFLDAAGDFIVRFGLGRRVLIIGGVMLAGLLIWKGLDSWGKRKNGG